MNKLNITNIPELPYAVEEAVNRLRVNINFLGNDVRKIMVVSTMPNEGKSFVTMQLWRQMAESGVSTVFLDVDLRKSVIVDKYGITSENETEAIRGTSYCLASEVPMEEAIYHTNIAMGDMLPNVDNIINPSMLLEGKRFEMMLNYAAENYRYTFLDCPPLNLVSDAERVGSLCDGAILVVRGGVTSKAMVRSSIQQLERANCPLLGIVLNRVKDSKGGYYYKRYGGKYYGSKYYTDEYYYGK